MPAPFCRPPGPTRALLAVGYGIPGAYSTALILNLTSRVSMGQSLPERASFPQGQVGGTRAIQTQDEGILGGVGMGETLPLKIGVKSMVHSPTGPTLTLPPWGVHLFHVPFHRAQGARPLLALPCAPAQLALQAASAWR